MFVSQTASGNENRVQYNRQSNDNVNLNLKVNDYTTTIR